MTTSTTKALTPDGVQRPFHAGHIRAGRLNGYVFARSTVTGRSVRVYGSINADCVGQAVAVFEPTGANARLVEGTFPVLAEVDTHAFVEDEASAYEERADFALANVD